ncbi:GAF domain-containing protein [Virgibacillus flavescens]|uniref:GAF domain-containing protein n=1 Tax=Virgibacillus flavescens TaxID=1611422 RepID=UPI003D3463D4
MSNATNLQQIKRLKNFDEAANTILSLFAKSLNVNTVFIAKNDQTTNEIVKVVNKKDSLLEVGDELPFDDTFCKLSVDHGNEALVIQDIKADERSNFLNVTKELGGGSFIGMPIYYENGENYGTICGLDNELVHFSEEDKALFETMASLLSYVLELDNADQEIENLSAPIVPLTEGIAILPIIGSVNEVRINSIIEKTLKKSQEMSLDYIVLDLSTITQMNEWVIKSLSQFAEMLTLLGVCPIITGMRPETALQANGYNVLFSKIKVSASLESALNDIGFKLEKN